MVADAAGDPMVFVLNFRERRLAELAVRLLETRYDIRAAIRPYPDADAPYAGQVWVSGADVARFGYLVPELQYYCRGIVHAGAYLRETPTFWSRR